MRPRLTKQFVCQKSHKIVQRVPGNRGVVVFEDDFAVSAAGFLIEGVFGEVFGPDVVRVELCALEEVEKLVKNGLDMKRAEVGCWEYRRAQWFTFLT
jgi:hypothetical protein